MAILYGMSVVALLAILAALGLRVYDRVWTSKQWRQIASQVSASPVRFADHMVADLPEPARRYFRYTIASGTQLSTVVEIQMSGEIGLGSKVRPNYVPMRAREILAPPHGLVWAPIAGSRLLRLSGSDGYSGEYAWTRLWLLGLIPVVCSGDRTDCARSAFGRLVAEAVFWAPAALLPQRGVEWELIDLDTARATLQHRGRRQSVDVRVDEFGQPVSVVLQRWSRENPEREWRLQPFGGTVEEVGTFGGYRLATRVSGGNHFGTDDYFPFFRARIERIKLGKP